MSVHSLCFHVSTTATVQRRSCRSFGLSTVPRFYYDWRCSTSIKPRDHVISALRQLLWLPIMHINSSVSRCVVQPHASVIRPISRTCWRPLAAADTILSACVVPLRSWTIGNRTFSVAAPRAWNRLPTELNSVALLIANKWNAVTIFKCFVWSVKYNLVKWNICFLFLELELNWT